MKNILSFNDFVINENITTQQLINDGYIKPLDDSSPYVKMGFNYDADGDNYVCDEAPGTKFAFNYDSYEENGFGYFSIYFRSMHHQPDPRQPEIEFGIQCSMNQLENMMKSFHKGGLYDSINAEIFDQLVDNDGDEDFIKKWFFDKANLSRFYIESQSLSINVQNLSEYELWKSSKKLTSVDAKTGIMSDDRPF